MQIHPMMISGYGLLELPFDEVVGRVRQIDQRPDLPQMHVIGTTGAPADVLAHLSIRTFPATRLALVKHGGWTAFLTNARHGSDFADHQRWMGKWLNVRSLRVVDRDARWWKRGAFRERLSYGARILEVFQADGSALRSIALADDGGRKVFETYGTPFPVESSFAYGAPRRKDRFTMDNLHAVLRAVGTAPLTEEAFLTADTFALIEQPIVNEAWRESVFAAACTLEEADDPVRGYFNRGMNADAPDVVIRCLERAIELDPSLEPSAREQLARARGMLKSV